MSEPTVEYRTNSMLEWRKLEFYDDGGPEWDWPMFVFGYEFGPVAVIRADSEGSAYGIWLDEYADVEDDLPIECGESWEKGEGCDCHRIAPNGPRTVDGSPWRYNSPYEWFKEFDPKDSRYRFTEGIEDE